MDAADRATLRMEAAIQRHAGWQLEYDFALVVNDRKQLLARIAELEAELASVRDTLTETEEELEHIRITGEIR